MKKFFSTTSLVSCTFLTMALQTETAPSINLICTHATAKTAPIQDVSIHAAVAVAELIDKLTILEIKLERFTDETKLKNVRAEYTALHAMYRTHVPQSEKLEALKKTLMKKNKRLWALEDAIRAKENSKTFDAEFVTLARDIYLSNDERGLIKRDINTLVGSHIIEEKSYDNYRTDAEAQKRYTSAQEPCVSQSTSDRRTITILVEMPVGELLDKITILEIKQKNITSAEKLKNIQTELAILYNTLNTHVSSSEQLTELTNQLRAHNAAMWEIEDKIREKERAQEFDAAFIQLARDVYYTNDKRCAVKRAINMLLGSRLIEEKKYTDYTA